MKVIYVSSDKFMRVLLVFFLVLISFALLDNLQGQTISVFLNTRRELPIYSVETQKPQIAISFDAAWGAEYTKDILNILEERNIRTTFFMVGFWVDKYPEMVREIARRGHEIGNHSTTHPHMPKLGQEQMFAEVTQTQQKIEELAGNRAVRLFRPPFGDYNDLLIRTLREMGYYTIQWDVDSLDWKELGSRPMYDTVTKKVRNGSIVLFHNNAKYITDALPSILDHLLAEGYEIIPISELIYKENYRIDHTGRQISLSGQP